MRLFIKLAMRNVRRNKRSTLLNGCGIALSAMVLLLVFSLSHGIEQQVVSRNVKFDTGALSVNFDKKVASFQNELEGNRMLNKTLLFLDRNEEVVSYSKRINISNSSIYLNDNEQKTQVIGISKEEIALLNEMLVIQEGTVSDLDESRIIISDAVADLLNMKLGDYCHVMVQTIDGAINLDEFLVSGIFRYTSQQNKFTVYMDYQHAKGLYNSNLPSAIFVNIRVLNRAQSVKTDWLKQLGSEEYDLSGEVKYKGLTIASYEDSMGRAKMLSTFNRYGMLSVAFFLILISFIGIWSMQTENIDERQREMGALFAFGFKRKIVKWIFLCESIYISGLFFVLGLILSLMVIGGVNLHEGVYLGESASFAFGSSIVNPILTFKQVFLVFILSLVYPFIATLLSLLVVNKKEIIEMLKN